MRSFLTVVLCLCFAGSGQAKKDRVVAHHAYVTNALDGTVSVIDTETNVNVATIKVGGLPFDVATSQNGLAYVLGETISVINTVTNTVSSTTSLPLSTFPYSCLKVSPSGSTLYVGEDGISRGVFEISTATHAIIDSTAVRVTSMAMSPNGDLYMILNASTLVVLNASTNVLSSIAGPWRWLSAIIVSPDGAMLYVADPFDAGDNVYAVSTASNKVLSVVPIGPTGNFVRSLAVSADGKLVYASNYNTNTVSVISTKSKTVTATIPVGKSPLGLAVSPGGFVYVVNSADNSVSVIDPKTDIVTAVISVGSGTGSIAIQ